MNNESSKPHDAYSYAPTDAYMLWYLDMWDRGTITIPTSFPQIRRFSLDFATKPDDASQLEIRVELNISEDTGARWKWELEKCLEIAGLEKYTIACVLGKWFLLTKSYVFPKNFSKEWTSLLSRKAIVWTLHIFKDILKSSDTASTPMPSSTIKELRYAADVEQLLKRASEEESERNVSAKTKNTKVAWEKSEKIRLRTSQKIMKSILRKASRNNKKP